MKEKILILIDVQNDFISGSLKNNIAESKIQNIVKKIKDFTGNHIFVTKDTHYDDYMRTREGVKLPVKHCIEGTWGWELHTDVSKALSEWLEQDKVKRIVHYITKHTFGSYDLAAIIDELDGEEKEIDMCGFCTDICVISNALILKERMYDNAEIHVYDDCCAGVTEGTHNAALTVMESCQINVHWHEDKYGNEERPKLEWNVKNV